MYIGHIAGIAFLPVSIILLLNAFGLTHLIKILGIPMMFLASIGIIVVQLGDIIDSHLKDESVILTWIIGAALCFPAIIYFLSLIIKMPESILIPLPIIIGSFLFVEGLSSFFIG